MALQVWLPLNKGLNNQGLKGDITATSTAVLSSTGSPIGGCYTFTASQSITITGVDFSKLTNASISVWVKQTSLVNTVFFTGPSVYHCVIAANENGTSEIYHSNNIGGVKKLYVDGVEGTKLGAAGQWHHYVVAGMNLSAWTGNVIKFNDYSMSFNFGGSVCDIRIYDHELSAKEIKEISKGLVQHFKLDESYGLTNMTNGVFGVYNNYSTGLTYTRQMLSETYMGQPVERFTYTINNQSCANGFKSGGYWSKGVYTGQYYVGASGSNIPFVYWVYYRPQSSGLTAGGTASNMGGWTEIPREYVGDGWWRVGQYRTNNTHATLKSDNIFTSLVWPYAGVGSSCTVDFTVAGYLLSGTTEIVENFVEGNSTVYDCSGYRNDGGIYGKPKQTQNTPRYEAATITSTNNCINAGRGGMVRDEITVSIWASMSSWGSFGGRLVSCTEGGGWNFEPNGGKMGFAMGTGASSNTYKNAVSTKTLASLSSGWHHFVGTYDGLATKIYIDGVLEGTNNAYSTKTPIFYVNNTVFIGAEAAANQSTPGGNYFDGSLSDYRVYGKALSADEILELYHTGASVDNKGNFFCGELKEE